MLPRACSRLFSPSITTTLLGGGVCVAVTAVWYSSSGVAGDTLSEPGQKEDLSHWAARWEQGRTGWQLDNAHPLLRRFKDHLFPDGGEAASVLVPLCGATPDLAFLRSQAALAVGVEGVEKPIPLLFTGDEADPMVKRGVVDGVPVWATQDHTLRVLNANYFDVTPKIAGMFDAVFDRAALVAVDPSERQQYVATTTALLKPGGRILLVVFDGARAGPPRPPHPVSLADVEALYGPEYQVTLLHKSYHHKYKLDEAVYMCVRKE